MLCRWGTQSNVMNMHLSTAYDVSTVLMLDKLD